MRLVVWGRVPITAKHTAELGHSQYKLDNAVCVTMHDHAYQGCEYLQSYGCRLLAGLAMDGRTPLASHGDVLAPTQRPTHAESCGLSAGDGVGVHRKVPGAHDGQELPRFGCHLRRSRTVSD